MPESILSDGGTQYQSTLLEQLYVYLDIKQLKTTAFHPQCDGLSEVTVKTTKAMIRANVDEDQTNWDENLAQYSYAYNTSVHSSTRQTPFYLMFNRIIKM
jgi:hypothetical protein